MSQEINNNPQQSRIDKLETLLVASPTDCFVLHALGLEYIKLGNLEKAIHYFEQVLTSDKDYIGTYYHLAKTLEKLNKIAEATQIYKQGIEIALKLKDNHARNELAMALEDIEE